jgi:16S rRNA G1207 methylase RsmC
LAPCGVLDGLNPDDPGLRMLIRHAREAAPARLLSVYSGPLQGVGKTSQVTRLILDVRESEESTPCVATRLEGLVAHNEAGAESLAAGSFDAAAFWPRAHLGKDFTLASFARAGRRLRHGGQLWCSVRKQKGGASLSKALGQLFGGVEVLERDRGYHLFCATKTEAFDEELAANWADARYRFSDERLAPLQLQTAPGVFSRKGLDAGTATLIDLVEAVYDDTPRRVLDLCAGVGPLALWAATRWSDARVDAIESNLLAVSCLDANAREAGVSARVDVHGHAGPRPDGGPYDLALINPPTHADEEGTRALVEPLATQMTPDAPAFFVVSRPGRLPEILGSSGARVRAWQSERYTVLGAKW